MLCAHQGEHCCYLIRPLRFSGSFHSSSGFFWGNNKNSRANAASEFVLFIFIYFCVFDSVGRHGHPAHYLFRPRVLSLYRNGIYPPGSPRQSSGSIVIVVGANKPIAIYYYYILCSLRLLSSSLSFKQRYFSLGFFHGRRRLACRLSFEINNNSEMLFSFQQEQLLPPKRKTTCWLSMYNTYSQKEKIKSLFILVNKFQKKKKKSKIVFPNPGFNSISRECLALDSCPLFCCCCCPNVFRYFSATQPPTVCVFFVYGMIYITRVILDPFATIKLSK